MAHAKPTLLNAFLNNFLGNAPKWYKLTIILFLALNPVLYQLAGSVVTSWVIILEFIFTLIMALSCYPLQPGGLITLEAVLLGLTTPDLVYKEAIDNISVIFLLMFMVAGIYFMKDLLLACFAKIIIYETNKIKLSILFLLISGILSAFLDALTVTAVIISIFYGFYAIYHKVASGKAYGHMHNHNDDDELQEQHKEDLIKFRSYLRSLIMHAIVGTALGGVCTIVGEPQNLLIAHYTNWDFMEYFHIMSPITMPILLAGIILCVILEKFKIFGYGQNIPSNVYKILLDYDNHLKSKQNNKQKAILIIQGIMAVVLIFSLAFHLAEVGLIGLSILILLTALNGITEELKIGHAFAESLPFTSLLVVFFALISIIHKQHLFQPIIEHVLQADLKAQPVLFYLANGFLSMISDNVFVASVYITEIYRVFSEGGISLEQFNKLAIAINIGTNIPSIATPNGQAAFLFLLTSALSPLIRLSYWRMVYMALPYTIILSSVALALIARL